MTEILREVKKFDLVNLCGFTKNSFSCNTLYNLLKIHENHNARKISSLKYSLINVVTVLFGYVH